MRLRSIIYLLWVAVTVALIYTIIQYGNRLRAPAPELKPPASNSPGSATD